MKPENKYADVPLRVKTWVYIILVFAIGISQPIAMKIFIAWIGFQVFYEFLKMFKVKTNRLIIAFIVGVTLFVLVHFFTFETYLMYSVIFSIVLITFFLIRKTSSRQLLGIVTGLILSLFVFPHLLCVRESIWGIKALIFLVVVTEFNDVFQYLSGKSFGKRSILPKISPNKTWAGLIGGVLITIILSTILGHFLLPSKSITNIILGFIIGVLGFFGDVFMSFLKRKTDVKDTGKLLPGHGGLLDRMDSLIFNAPIFFWVLPLLLKH